MLENAQVYSSLPAKDVERAKKFYQEKLGLIPKEESSGNVVFEVGGSKFFLYESPSAGTNQATAACFDVDNVENVVAEMKNKGVEFEEYDGIPGVLRQGEIHTNEHGMQCAWFKDTEGNIISVSQYV